MKITLKNLVSVLMLIAMGSSCSKTTPPLEPLTPPVVIEPVTPPPSSPNLSKLAPIKFESKSQTINLKYLGNTSLLISIDDNNGKRGIVKYNSENLIIGYENYENNELVYMIDYFRDANQRINNVNQFKVKGAVYTPTGYYTLEYNVANQLSIIKYYSAKKQLLSTKTLTYDLNSNRNSLTKDLGTEEKGAFTYDQKNGICKYVNNAQLISLETQEKFFSCIYHNLLTRTGTPSATDYSLTYEYNTDAYPNQITINEFGTSTIFKVTYKTL